MDDDFIFFYIPCGTVLWIVGIVRRIVYDADPKNLKVLNIQIKDNFAIMNVRVSVRILRRPALGVCARGRASSTLCRCRRPWRRCRVGWSEACPRSCRPAASAQWDRWRSGSWTWPISCASVLRREEGFYKNTETQFGRIRGNLTFQIIGHPMKLCAAA